MILDVAGALHVVRLEALAAEFAEQRGQRLLDDIHQRVQPAPMRHADGDFVHPVRGSHCDHRMQRRDRDLAAFQTESLGGDVALLAERLERLGLGQLLQDGAFFAGVERGVPGRALDVALDPGFLLRILNMHELHADMAAVRLAQDAHDLPQCRGFAAEHVVDENRPIHIGFGEAVRLRIEFAVRRGDLQPQRIEPCLEMAANPIRSDQHQRPHARRS